MKPFIKKITGNRFTYMVPVGALISWLLHLNNPVVIPQHNVWYDVILAIVITVFIWEGNEWIDKSFNKIILWEEKPLKRALFQGAFNIFFSVASIYFFLVLYDQLVCAFPEEARQKMMGFSILIGTLISTIILSVKVGTQFFVRWKQSITEVEKYKQEALNTQLKMLKGQINPHFLFNNLSVLASLIQQDADTAVTFTSEFARVYRHLLNIRNSELTTLDEELDFLDSYCYLLKIRFGEGIVFNKQIEKNAGSMYLPPLTLQVLLENCVQHNKISLAGPLVISIMTEKDLLVIRNPIIPKSSEEKGSGLGHQNIALRLKPFTDRKMQITNNDNWYTVKVPLIKSV